MKGEINESWHSAHRMPNNPTRKERIEWHAQHMEACGCRSVPAALVAEVRAYRGKRGYK